MSTHHIAALDQNLRNERPGNNLKEQTIRGGAVTLLGQLVKVVLNTGSTVVLARLLTPTDYGLIGMVTAVIGFVQVFKDAGLSMATVQRDRITHEQISTLFWLNIALSVVLMLGVALLAPSIAWFFRDPRLIPIALVLASTFVLSGLTVQHQALLRRDMRFTALTVIDVGSLLGGALVAFAMAAFGLHYWALVAISVVTALINAVCVWLAMSWRPGRPHRNCGVRGMIGFGGNIVGQRLTYSFIRDMPNVMLGWYWGAGAVGLYQRAYTLLMFSVDQVQTPLTAVAMSPMSRLQRDTARLRTFFLAYYSTVVSCIVPIVVTCALFSDGIVLLILGPQWEGAVPVFRWLALSGVFVGLLHPQGTLLIALGEASKCLKLGLVDATCVVLAAAIGLPHGPAGVAISFLLVKGTIAIPMTITTFRDTPVSSVDIINAVIPSLLSITGAAAVGWALRRGLSGSVTPTTVTLIGVTTMMVVYAAVLMIVFGKWRFYRDIATSLISRNPPTQAAAAVS